jgi:nicotinate-nucleotide adenylyltransferase
VTPAVRRLGVLGGTFDPVHIGHLILAEAAREAADLDSVLFVPTGHSWRKPERQITPGEERLEMLRLAVQDNEHFAVSDAEVERPGPSYTHVTLGELATEYPGAELYFILGRDALLDLPNWKDPARIAELATLLLAERAGEAAGPGEAAIDAIGGRILWVAMPLVEVSATDIRERVGQGRSIRYLTPRPVGDYIAKHGLYARR